MSTNKNNGFGRDEMNALLGGGLPERLVRQQLPAAVPGGVSAKKKVDDDQVSNMTAAETAAWLLKQQKEKAQGGAAAQVAPKVQRHRAARMREYHQLLQEEFQNEVIVSNHSEESVTRATKSEQSDEEEEFMSHRQQQIRVKAEPIVLGRRRRRTDSSASSSSSESDDDTSSRAQLRRKPEDSGSDSDDSAADRRRQRLIQQRRTKAIENVDTHEPPVVAKRSESEEARGIGRAMRENATEVHIKASEKVAERSSGESSVSGAASSESDSSEESSSESENESVPRPVFIPKHKRGIIQALAEKEAEEAAMVEKEKALLEKRKKESRALVQEVLTTNAMAAPDLESAFEGITGAENEVPDDTDREDELAQERERWELRELMRLINDIDEERRRKEEEKELERRRQMTDEERLREDIETGRYKRPGEAREKDNGGTASRRYLHRGAFYMDESEWDESDIRRKAAEYARAPTDEDAIDRKALPKVMQVKKFGFANQSKYKGLAAEDTTDKRLEMLPLLSQPKRKKSF